MTAVIVVFAIIVGALWIWGKTTKLEEYSKRIKRLENEVKKLEAKK